MLTPDFGLVTGRISSLALDSSDATGNKLYVGTTGGGVWFSQNAAASDPTKVVFTPLTDRPSALSSAIDGSISIGALTVQPNGTGVILAGTGDPNDALDSYYGAGVLRSTDGGNNWTLIQGTSDVSAGLSGTDHRFYGEGFAGFAWWTPNPPCTSNPPCTQTPNLVVAAVSQSYESSLVDAGTAGSSYSGLYWSDDAGATWHLATITDGGGHDVQGPNDVFAGAEGNAATSVVWNPIRGMFLAAVRFHGYYQSSDGKTWTRLQAQPGDDPSKPNSGLSTHNCPTDTSMTGSPDCPIFRGTLAVNPVTGDTFAWTVDLNNQDQGLWQNQCNLSGKVCTNASLTLARQWSTAVLETATSQGAQTILNGDYNLALSAVPSQQDTLLLAGANDLWKCSLAAGCAWRNTTNSTTCVSARVGEYLHALEWSTGNPLEVFAGNDRGLWRSEDAIAETGSACSASDASHWQNLNGGIGSLAEVESLPPLGNSTYTLMAGLGVSGTAGVTSTTGPTTIWPQILGGEGGPVAIDPSGSNWYINNGAGVSIHACSMAGACTPADFGSAPAVNDADVSNDGLTMTEPAAFLVDPADPSQLLIATCRLWRGPASGSGWAAANAVTPMLGSGSYPAYCSGNPLIRSIAAIALAGGGEVVYVGTFGSLNGGGNLPGHALKAAMNASGTWSGWTDLTLNPVTNDNTQFNSYGLDISSIFVDPIDATGNTVYATIAGMPDRALNIRTAYRSTDGGAHWKNIMSNLQYAPANSLVVDPADTNTVYMATDAGVFATRQVGTCSDSGVNCWFAYGTGLPESPVVALRASPTTGSPNVLVAGTYGRGIWQIPLFTAGLQMTTATANPSSLTFPAQPQGTMSSAQTVTLTNTGGIALLPTNIAASGDFLENDNCANESIGTGSSCSIKVSFLPSGTGTRNGTLTIEGNLSGGSITVGLSGTGDPPGVVTLSPPSVNFGSVEAGTTSAALSVTAENTSQSPVPINSVTVTGPFVLSSNGCGTSLAPNSDCQLAVEFSPVTAGTASGTLNLADSAGTQTVRLSGMGTAPPTDTLSGSSLTFSGTVLGVRSAAQTVTLTNSGGNPLTSIAISTAGPFQQTSNCTTQLTGPASCSISVVFLPTALGAQTGTLTIADILRTQTVSLQGTGLMPPAFTVSPAQVNFPNTGLGNTSSPITVTLANPSTAAELDNLALTASVQFAVASSTCGNTLATGSSCTAALTFTPAALGAQSGALTIATGGLSANATVPLSGIGFDFTPSTSGSATQTVASGQTAMYTLTVTPTGGGSDNFSFQCKSLPQYAACVFNPTTLTLASGTTGTETVQITTSQASAQMQPPAWIAGPWPLSLACLVVLVPLTRRRRARLLLILVAGLSVAVATSCSGSGGGGGGTPGPSPTTHNTPTGTYSIPVVISSNGLNRTVTLTLVVD